MLKFFRKIRKELLTHNRLGKYTIYAVGEIVLVVIGILIALQINNWNEELKSQSQEKEILERLQSDLRDDMKTLQYQIDLKKRMIDDYGICLEILSEKRPGTKEEFMTHFQSILQVGAVFLNETTFNNLQTTGQIRLIRNSKLADNIVSYYNTDYTSWQSALSDYTRNITAPYILEFDYVPKIKISDFIGQSYEMTGRPESFVKPQRSLNDYKNNYFIINTLRMKRWNLEALQPRYKMLFNSAKELDLYIKQYLEDK